MNESYYRLGALRALSNAGLIKAASTGSLFGAALAGKLVGGGLGAAYPQAMGLDPNKRVLGGALGALLGGGLGIGAHESVRYFRNLAELGRPIVEKSEEAAIEGLNKSTEAIRETIRKLKGA